MSTARASGISVFFSTEEIEWLAWLVNEFAITSKFVVTHTSAANKVLDAAKLLQECAQLKATDKTN